ncbi:MAG: OB-fold nucleic acid binding domain-containing protein [Candidatus Geothermarchaeales archaeon]
MSRGSGVSKGKKHIIEVCVEGEPIVRYHYYARDLHYALSEYEPDYPNAEIKYWEVDESNARIGAVNTSVRSPLKALENVEMDKEESFTKISDLSGGMKDIRVQGRVLEVSEARKVMSRFGGILRLSIAVISDGDGKINLALWNQRIGSISVGDTVQIEKGRVTEYYGVKQLNIGKYGELKVIN